MTNKERAFELFKLYMAASRPSEVESDDHQRHMAKRACQAVEAYDRVADEWFAGPRCQYCAGTDVGRVGNSEQCAVCRGKGEPKPVKMSIFTCSRCGGRRVVAGLYNDIPCPDCNPRRIRRA